MLAARFTRNKKYGRSTRGNNVKIAAAVEVIPITETTATTLATMVMTASPPPVPCPAPSTLHPVYKPILLMPDEKPNILPNDILTLTSLVKDLLVGSILAGEASMPPRRCQDVSEIFTDRVMC